MQVLHDALAQHTAQGQATGEAVATFESVGLLAPRGRFEVEMFVSSMTLSGQVSLKCMPSCSYRLYGQMPGRRPFRKLHRAAQGCCQLGMLASMTLSKQVALHTVPALSSVVSAEAMHMPRRIFQKLGMSAAQTTP